MAAAVNVASSPDSRVGKIVPGSIDRTIAKTQGRIRVFERNIPIPGAEVSEGTSLGRKRVSTNSKRTGVSKRTGIRKAVIRSVPNSTTNLSKTGRTKAGPTKFGLKASLQGRSKLGKNGNLPTTGALGNGKYSIKSRITVGTEDRQRAGFPTTGPTTDARRNSSALRAMRVDSSVRGSNPGLKDTPTVLTIGLSSN